MINFSNSQNWHLIDSNQISAVTVTNQDGTTGYVPISPKNIPIIVEGKAIAVYVDTENAKPTWKNAGFVAINIFTGLTNDNYSSEIKRAYLGLKKVNIIIIPTLSQTTSLTLFIPRWFKSVYWNIWEYIGDGIPDNEGKLDLILDILQQN